MRDVIHVWLPVYRFRERHRVVIPATDAAIWHALYHTDLTRNGLVRLLFRLRGLVRGAPTTLDALQQHGFLLLSSKEPEHVVLGLIARPWTPGGGVRQALPREFVEFDEPGYVRVAWGFSIRPVTAGCVLSTETRVAATDAAARRAFSVYWWLVGPFSSYIRRRMLREIARAVADH